MDTFRREFLKLAGTGLAGATASAVVAPGARADVKVPIRAAGTSSVHDVRTFGATGDGKTIDSPAINKAIETAAAAGGGTVLFPSGVYASYSIQVGVDLWDFHTEDKRSIGAALDFLLPYANGAKQWDYQQIGGFHGDALLHVLERAAAQYEDPRYAAAIEQLGKGKDDPETVFLRPSLV